MKLSPKEWPNEEEKGDDQVINQEVRKTNRLKKKRSVVALEENITMNNTLKVPAEDVPWYLIKFSEYPKVLRMIAWILRFTDNCRKDHVISGQELKAKEIIAAELLLCKLAQQESFEGKNDPTLRDLNVFEQNGIIRTKTIISNRQDTFSFRCPVVLNPAHLLTKMIIEYTHLKLNHAGINIVMNNLREKFWIRRCRKVVQTVIKKCVICRRHAAKNITAPPGLLPENRVRDAAAFEVTGIDYAGPLLLRGGQKAYVCLFTCAVYRAVHLELVTSLTTEEFLQGLRRFIARRGRPSVIYSDNGTNFVGASNLLKKINWNKISRYCTINEID